MAAQKPPTQARPQQSAELRQASPTLPQTRPPSMGCGSPGASMAVETSTPVAGPSIKAAGPSTPGVTGTSGTPGAKSRASAPGVPGISAPGRVSGAGDTSRRINGASTPASWFSPTFELPQPPARRTSAAQQATTRTAVSFVRAPFAIAWVGVVIIRLFGASRPFRHFAASRPPVRRNGPHRGASWTLKTSQVMIYRRVQPTKPMITRSSPRRRAAILLVSAHGNCYAIGPL